MMESQVEQKIVVSIFFSITSVYTPFYYSSFHLIFHYPHMSPMVFNESSQALREPLEPGIPSGSLLIIGVQGSRSLA